jgi:hypothetical protein
VGLSPVEHLERSLQWPGALIPWAAFIKEEGKEGGNPHVEVAVEDDRHWFVKREPMFDTGTEVLEANICVCLKDFPRKRKQVRE